MGVIDLEAERLAREPHLSGPVRCLNCRHEWVGVAPCSALAQGDLECSACGSFTGVFVNPPIIEGPHWTCRCGTDVFRYHMDKGMYCAHCGTVANPT